MILVLCLALGAKAHAQTNRVDHLEQDARLRFELGQRAYDRGEFVEAAREFEEAYRLSNRAPLLFNAYIAYRDGQQDARALDALRRYLAAAGDIPNRARLERTQRELEAALRGEQPPPSEPATSAPNDPGGAPATFPMGPIVVLSAGAVAGIAAIVTGALALDRNDDLSAACPNDVCTSDNDAHGIQADVEALSIATDVLWPIGVAVLAVGVVWLAIDLSSGGEGASALRAGCGPLGCSARLEGTFQ